MEISPQFDLDRFHAGIDLCALAERAWRRGSWLPDEMESALDLAGSRCADPSILFFRRETDRQSSHARDLGLSLLRLAHEEHPIADPLRDTLLREAPLWLAGNAFARREAFGYLPSAFASDLCFRIGARESALIPWEGFFSEARDRSRALMPNPSALCFSASLLASRGCRAARCALSALASFPPGSLERSILERQALADISEETDGRSGRGARAL